MTNCRRVWPGLLGLTVILMAFGGSGIVGCQTGCEVLSTQYTLAADCLEEGAETKETCKIEQTECTIVMTCGEALQHCRGYMTGTSINLSCTLANQRNAQVLADPKDSGYQLLFVQANACKAQMTPVP